MKAWKELMNAFVKTVSNRHVNEITTFFLIALGYYVTLMAVTGQNFANPLEPITYSKTLNLNNAANEILQSIVSVFIIVVISLIIGKIVKIVYIPTLIGCMVFGIAIKNIAVFNEFFYINSYWQFILRKLSLVTIIIRWGISINVKFIKENYVFPAILGIGSATAEALAIFVVAVLFFNFSPALAIICGFVVGTVSPAVAGPVLGYLRRKNIGMEKRIPDIVPAACCFDNCFSLLIFSLTAAVTFTNESPIPTLVKNIGAIVLAVVIGLVIGFVIRYFPRGDVRHTHLGRFMILTSMSYGVIMGMIAMGYQFPGIVASLVICCVSGTKWREDNPKKIDVLVHQCDNFWYFLCVPVLFTLVGYTFDFSKISLYDVKVALILLIAGSLIRLIVSMVLSASAQFNLREQFIIGLCLVPKATVQCALAPSLILLTDDFPELREKTQLIITICIIAVLVTSPIVDILLYVLAPRLLRQSSSQTVHISGVQLVQDSSGNLDTKTSNSIFTNDDAITFEKFRALYGNASSNSPFNNSQMNNTRPTYQYVNKSAVYS
ncbi:unnamed protein product [Caenorhabditis bovis]|uniref:Cation/H+ exchanger transmembrane domain-containing protein n=1 Tax=Caenorhabditis bovis TaxID=2654633 RepID=A0A8S1EGH0_9PELO|nr:unnamed protein product [Caenorhabditis bovis]